MDNTDLLLISRETGALGLGPELLNTITKSVLCWLPIPLFSFIQDKGIFIQCFFNEIGLCPGLWEYSAM